MIGGAARRAAPAGASSAWILTVALSVALGLPLIRVLSALLYGLRESRGAPIALLIAAAVFSTPMLAVALRCAIGAHAATATSLVGLAAAVVAVQLAHPIAWWLAGCGVACALVAWTLLLQASRAPVASGSPFAVGFMLGLMIDTSVHASLDTWDAAWQSTPRAMIVTFALALTSVATVSIAIRRSPRNSTVTADGNVMRIAAFGPFLALQVLFLHNVAFAGASSGTSIAVGAGAVWAGAAGALAMATWGSRWTTPAFQVGAVVTVVVLAWILTSGPGWTTVPMLVAVGGMSGWLLSIALSGPDATDSGDRPGTAWRTGVAPTVGSLAFVALVFGFQIHASQPLPVSNRLLPPLGALMLGAAALGRLPERRATPVPRRLIVVGALLTIAIPILLAVAAPSAPTTAVLGSSMRIVSWNVHSAVDADGQVVPDVVAATIAAQDADVVVLQEVSRGWPIGGSLDLVAWLSVRLDMPYVWGPAADAGFGNAVLSRAPIIESSTAALPFGSGPQHRSFVRVVLDADGSPITVVGTHLESGAGTDTRSLQIETLLRAVEREEQVVIAGDMNMQPADGDVVAFLDAGFHSAQENAGHPAASTAREPGFPGDRPDWIFGSRAVTFTDFAIVQSDASDHRPLAVTVSW